MRRFGFLLAGLLVWLMTAQAWAATYTFSSGGLFNPSSPPPCTGGSWSRSGSTFTCTGSVTLAAGDVLQVSTSIFEGLDDIVVIAQAGWSLNSNTIGTSSKNITLRSTYGALTSTGSSTQLGSVISDSGNLTLSGMSITGSVSTGGSLSLSSSSVSGNVSANGGVTSSNATVGGTLTSSTGSISLTGGSVTGLVTSGCCTVTSSNTNLLGGARSNSSGLQISGGTLQGDFYANNNTATFTGVTMTSGSISGASTVTITDSTIGSSSNSVNVTAVSGAVTLNNSTAFGTLTAPSYSTIYVNSPSKVYGTCIPNSTPANACQSLSSLTCFNDNFSSSLSNDWAVVSRSGSFGQPRVVNGRLRLTDDSNNVSTAATLLRLIPAEDNYVEVILTLSAYSSSSSRGADGVAVILSDATVTPQPGSFGGSLGYAQRDDGTSGFAGGWLGVGLDEYGNFSNPTEGRSGGPGFRSDAIAIRGSGSGTTGYRYLAGTATLSTGVDNPTATTTPNPNHRYRLRVDSRTAGQSLVSLERDTGSGFQTLVASFNARAASGQAAVPDNFYLSFTGSTGGSVNIHELDNLQVCALKLGSAVNQIDHFELVYPPTALTCNPLAVTLRACADAACSNTYAGAVSATLSPSGWVGGNTQSFTGGTTNLQLRVTTPSSVTLGVSSSTPPVKPFTSNLCSNGGALSTNCAVTFADSGFVFDVPNTLAAKPTAATLRAVKKDDATQACVPGFSNGIRSVQFSRSYTNPASGTLPVQVNGSAVTSNTDVSLSFDAMASAPLTVQYADAGQITLDARYAPTSGTDAGLVMTGSDQFVSKPYGLLLQTDTVAGCTAADISCPLYPGGVRAGDPVSLRIKAVAWQSDGEALTAAALADNSVTPNFQLNGIALASQVQAPAGGSNGTLWVSSYSHGLGAQTALSNQSISEVGVFRIAATPPANAYFGETVSASVSGLVGRFAPAFLQASGEAALTPSCGTAFSYQGQPMAFASGQDPRLTVTAFNRQNGVTGNYDRGDFWRLNLPGRDDYLSVTGKASLDTPGRLQAQGTLTTSQSGADGGDGARTWRWSGEQLLYAPATVPQADDLPFNAAIRQGFSASALTDADGACVGNGSSCQTYSYDFSGSQVRLGRLSIGNAHGSELQPLALPLRLESWQGSSTGLFQLERADTCTAAVLGQPQLGTPTGNLSVGDTTASLSSPALTEAQGVITLTAPGAGNDGSVPVSLPTPTACIAGQANCLPDWLWYDWRGAGREAPQGLATFGVYRGAAPLIYRRELYR